MKSKIKSASSLSRIVAKLRGRGRKVVFTNGCFDILHPGHVVYLDKASRLGDLLVVGLNSDKSVRAIKGNGRPINGEHDRAYVLSALGFVDYITVFSENTPERLIRKLKPDVLVKGGDWKVARIVGGDFVRSRGGRVVSIKFVKGYSTSSLLEKMRKK
ncbi:MAG: D-glycero-beta-D-manno-heptose 1-phosphate adenylyltransferase [Candidatus Omnitrophica bacterium]|nr:D-glycero-beta-D-manno-heptose 1-phosphate adenylyltransferase [Candidatus Omnitrophota bacterium]